MAKYRVVQIEDRTEVVECDDYVDMTAGSVQWIDFRVLRGGVAVRCLRLRATDVIRVELVDDEADIG